MNLTYRTGRPSIAVELQSSLSATTNPKQQRVEKANARTKKLEDGLDRSKPSGAATDTGDRWESRGANGVWVREHRTPREALFTPCKVARGPAHPDRFAQVRVTRGCFVNGGIFTIEDSWRSGSAHALLSGPWTGTTTFTSTAVDPHRSNGVGSLPKHVRY